MPTVGSKLHCDETTPQLRTGIGDFLFVACAYSDVAAGLFKIAVTLTLTLILTLAPILTITITITINNNNKLSLYTNIAVLGGLPGTFFGSAKGLPVTFFQRCYGVYPVHFSESLLLCGSFSGKQP